jgi:hypothetical protein
MQDGYNFKRYRGAIDDHEFIGKCAIEENGGFGQIFTPMSQAWTSCKALG